MLFISSPLTVNTDTQTDRQVSATPQPSAFCKLPLRQFRSERSKVKDVGEATVRARTAIPDPVCPSTPAVTVTGLFLFPHFFKLLIWRKATKVATERGTLRKAEKCLLRSNEAVISADEGPQRIYLVIHTLEKEKKRTKYLITWAIEKSKKRKDYS